MAVINLLLLEDEPMLRRLYASTFETFAPPDVMVVVHNANSVYDAVRILVSTSIDVMLLDLCVADSYGTDTLYRVQRYSCDIPIVVLTGLRTDTVQAEADDLAHTTILSKLSPGAVGESLVSHVISQAAAADRSQAGRYTYTGKSLRRWITHERRRWREMMRSRYARVGAVLLVLVTLASSLLWAVPVLADPTPTVPWVTYEAAVTERIRLTDDYIGLVKTVSIAVVTALVAAIGLLFRSLVSAHNERIAGLMSESESRGQQIERVTVALTDATRAMESMAVRVGEVATKMDVKLDRIVDHVKPPRSRDRDDT